MNVKKWITFNAHAAYRLFYVRRKAQAYQDALNELEYLRKESQRNK